ncbi:MAG: phage portal protein, partial [Thermomicrobiales bacterium]
IYTSQIWVHTVVNKLARGIGRLPLKTYQRQGQARERVYDSPLATLLRQPFPGCTPTMFKQAIVGNVALYGNAIAIKVARRPDQPVEQLYPVPPVFWYVNESGDYVWRAPRSGEEIVFPRWKIVHFQFWAPTATGFSLSPMEPLRKTLVIEDSAQRLGAASFQNGARPSGALSTDQVLSDTAIQRVSENIKRLHGGPDKAFNIAVLDGGLKWQPFSHNLNESAVVDHRKLTREEVCAVYDVPPPIVGILDHATFSNIEEQHLMLYMDTLGPWLTMIDETIQVQLIDGVSAYQDQFVEFDLAEVLKGNTLARAQAFVQFSQAGVYTPNELRALENLPPSTQPEADEIHVSLALGGSQTGAGRSGTGIPEPPAAPMPGEPTDADEPGGA